MVQEIKESINRLSRDENESKATDRLSVLYNTNGQMYHFNILPIFNPNPSDQNKSRHSNQDLESVDITEPDNLLLGGIFLFTYYSNSIVI